LLRHKFLNEMDNASAQLERAHKTAKALATISIVCVLATTYAWTQKNHAEKQNERIQEELEHCKQEKKQKTSI